MTHSLSDQQKKKIRAEQNRQAKQRQRDKERSQGDVTIIVRLGALEWAEYHRLWNQQRGPTEGFSFRALMTGARFLANAGTPKGKKALGNGNTAARRVAIADKSS